MIVLLTTVHIIICFLLVAIVLLQAGKGAEIGAAFGGGASQTMFGSRGAATVFQKATAAVAITFMLTSLGLAYFSRQTRGGSVVDEAGGPPVTQSAPAEAGAGAAGEAGTEGAADETGLPGAPGDAVLPGIPVTPGAESAGDAPAPPASPAEDAPPGQP